jgi:hypothetical protein
VGGSGSGVTLDLSHLPGGGSSLSSVVDVSVTLNTVTAFASDDGLTTPPLRTATVTGGSVTVALPGGVLPPITLPLTIDRSPNADLLTAIVSSLTGNPLLTGVMHGLTSDLSGVLDLETNFQPPPVSGTFSVTALHVGVFGASAGDLDVGTATVGPNTPPPVIAAAGLDLTSGSSYGGTLVTITGTGFTGATAVNFGITPAITFAVDSDTTIIATSPADTPGAVPVTVVTPIGTSNGEPFTFISPAPIISPNGLDPASGPTAGGTTVTLNGTGLFGVTAVEFGDAIAPTVTVDSDTSITAVTPAQAAGPVQVTALNPSSGTSNVETFTFVAPPVVATGGIGPDEGSTEGGTTVAVTGTGFTGDTAVDFDATPGTNLVVNSDTQITVTSPAQTAGPTQVTVVTPSGTSNGETFTFVAPASAATLSPSSGPIGGGTRVTISGTDLAGATSVDFGPGPATVISDTGTQVVATTPPGVAGTVAVTVTTPGGTSSPGQFTYTTPPSAQTVDPSSGPTVGGTTVTISGTDLAGATSVDFGPSPATVISDTGTRIVVTTPPGAPGAAVVTVATPGGASSPADFAYAAAPSIATIDGIVADMGPTAGGTTVTIIGTNFIGANHLRLRCHPGRHLHRRQRHHDHRDQPGAPRRRRPSHRGQPRRHEQ